VKEKIGFGYFRIIICKYYKIYDLSKCDACEVNNILIKNFEHSIWKNFLYN